MNTPQSYSLPPKRPATRRDLAVATVAHDLRGPLGTIRAVLDLVLDDLLPDDDAHQVARRQLAVARRVSQQMLTLVGELLESASLEARRADRYELCRPDDILAAAEEALVPLARERAVAVVRDSAHDLPAVRADRDSIARVFSNLGANAAHYTPSGGQITLRATWVSDAVCFAVADTGSGIAANDLPRVFDRFWRADPSSGSGVGLGLAIVKDIVDAHGGRIWVESQPASGSTFSFTVPAAPAEVAFEPVR